MSECWTSYLTWASIALGFVSAACWLRASIVKIDRKKAVSRRVKEAEKRGEEASHASVTLDGWDMSATFKAQSKWNARGAFFAACMILFQVIIRIVENVSPI